MTDPFNPEPQVPVDHYSSRAYNSKPRIASFWHQVDEVLEAGARTALEIGPGSGFVTRWLRSTGVEVTTLDMDPAVQADAQGSVTELPFPTDEFDAAMCCQVLEHLPFEEVPQALAELGRVARATVVISVPDATPWFGFTYPLYFPGWYLVEARERMPTSRRGLVRALVRREFRFRDWLFFRLVPARWQFGGPVAEPKRVPIPRGPWRPEPGSEHYWEVGSEGHHLERLFAAVDAASLNLVRTYRVPENPWHRFLVLKPR
jgi:SAM-dependent methyltransferase